MTVFPQDKPHPQGGTGVLASSDLTMAAFSRIARIARREAGLSIADSKTAMVKTRLSRRLRALRLPSFEAYCDLIEGDNASSELGFLISALTTNVSQFFRESHHFDLFTSDVIPKLAKISGTTSVARVWSAGCSNGQEPYSIAMCLAEYGLGSPNVRILATDIDPVVIATAREGVFPDHMLTGLPVSKREAFFSRTQAGDWQIQRSIRDMVSFNCLNLLDTWPIQTEFDAIFCRNVVIYFDKETQSSLWQRFASVMKAESYLFLGHSERLDDASDRLFEKVGITAYRRTTRSTPNQRKVG
ncbi:MAG TPA: chemotaxis protein [Maritimibacter sp.]|nr:chemotaxis protein [Maritimibacter sp.]